MKVQNLLIYLRNVVLFVTLYFGGFWLLTYDMTWRKLGTEAWDMQDYEKRHPRECGREETGCNWRDRQIHESIKNFLGIASRAQAKT